MLNNQQSDGQMLTAGSREVDVPKRSAIPAQTDATIGGALLDCLEQARFSNITVQMIIQRAGVNRTTFYKYFYDKYDLLDHYLDGIMAEFNAEMNYDFVKARQDEISNPFYGDLFRNSESFIRKNSRIYKILWNPQQGFNLYDKMLEIQKTNIFAAISTDPFFTADKTLVARLYADLLASNFMITIRWWMENSASITFTQVSDLMKSNMERGIFQTFRAVLESPEAEIRV